MNLEMYAEERSRRWAELLRADVVDGELPFQIFLGKHSNVFFTDENRTQMVYVFAETAKPIFCGKHRWPPPVFCTSENDDVFDFRPFYSARYGVESLFWLKYGEVNIFVLFQVRQ